MPPEIKTAYGSGATVDFDKGAREIASVLHHNLDDAQAWLQEAAFACERVRERMQKPNALPTYLKECCEGKPAPLIAAHAIGLHLWAQVWSNQNTIGMCTSAACRVLGIDPESVLPGRVLTYLPLEQETAA